MIEAKNISFCVKGRNILQALDFRSNQEEFVVILGPNGAGKSTLVKLLSGGMEPSSGDISYYGKKLKDWSLADIAKYRAYMHQESMISSSFTVRQVLEMARYRFSHTQSKFNQDAVARIVTDLNLEHLLDAEFNFLSGGEKQRVQFGRVLLQLQNEGEIQPIKYLFLDEPLNNLDVRYQIELLNYARNFVDQKMGSVIVVMHDINLCYQYADRVLLMDKGRIINDGTIEEVMDPEVLSRTYQIDLEQIKSLEGDVFYRHLSYSANIHKNNINN